VRTGRWLPILCVIVGFDTLGCFPSSRDSSFFGEYKRNHEIGLADSTGWVTTTVTDSLVLAPISDGKISFEFFLNHDNGHTCWMQGVAIPVDGYFEYRESRKNIINEALECVLRIRVSLEAVTLEDETSWCTRIYCGVRGYIDGISFSRGAK